MWKFRSVVFNNGVDLPVDRGEVAGLLEHNGADNTTLVLVLMGLFIPDAGTIYVDTAGRLADPTASCLDPTTLGADHSAHMHLGNDEEALRCPNPKKSVPLRSA